jgi:hypothetical protein
MPGGVSRGHLNKLEVGERGVENVRRHQKMRQNRENIIKYNMKSERPSKCVKMEGKHNKLL